MIDNLYFYVTNPTYYHSHFLFHVAHFDQMVIKLVSSWLTYLSQP